MTADAPMEYDLYKLSGLKWANKDIELETASGLIPCIYSGKAPVSSLQWAIGLELFLMTVRLLVPSLSVFTLHLSQP